MSSNRSNYTDDYDDQWQHIMWRGAVTSAIRGKRGQALLVELRDRLDAMPEKRLVDTDLTNADGEHCALGVVVAGRGIDPQPIQEKLGQPDFEWGYEEDDVNAYCDALSATLDVAPALVREVMFINDDSYTWWRRRYNEQGPMEDPAKRRWTAVRNWVESQILR